MRNVDYSSISEYPETISAQTVIIRMLDGLGFRFYWAVKGLNEEDFAFLPAPGRWSILETIDHIWGLVYWIHGSLYKGEGTRPDIPVELIDQVLEMISQIQIRFEEMDDTELDAYRLRGKPFWNLINGPIEDAVYHTGQIDTLRRIAGNPPENAAYFTGEPPKGAT